MDTRSAYQDLPGTLKEVIRHLYLTFSFRYQLLGFQAAKYSAAEASGASEYPDVVHPLVRQHPVSGRGSLYLDQLCVAGVAGQTEAQGRELLDRLYAHALVESRVYQHIWRDGDLLIWDNPSLMHRRGNHHQGSRLLHRTSIAGPVPVILADDTV